jgi:hypothetical protein
MVWLSSSGSPIGCSLGSSRPPPGMPPVPPACRRNASARARAARRLGNSTVIFDKANGSPPARAIRPAAKASAKGTPVGIVKTVLRGVIRGMMD